MSTSSFDNKVYQLEGIAIQKYLAAQWRGQVRYTLLNNMKIDLFSELKARLYINIKKHNHANVVIGTNGLIIITINIQII